MPTSRLNSFPGYMLLCIIALFLINGLCYFSGRTFIREGPAAHLYLTTRDIWENGSIASDRFAILAEELRQKSAQEHITYWQDVFSVTISGEFYPKHCFLLSLIASPFYGLMGEFGIWIFSQLLIIFMLASLYRICVRLSAPCPGVLLLIACFAGSELTNFIYQFDPDVLGAALVICGLDLTFRFPLFGSFLLGLSVFTRPLYLVLAPILLLPSIVEQPMKLRCFDLLLGCLCAFCLEFAVNKILWGTSLTFAQNRFPMFTNGKMIFSSVPVTFSPATFLSNWREKLFDLNVGFITTNPILILTLFAFRDAGLHLGRRALVFAILIFAIAQFVLIYSYSGWAVTPSGGNRYLLPTTLLLTALLVASVSQIWFRISKEN